MGLFGDVVNNVYNAGQGLVNSGKNLLEDISTWCNNLVGDVGAAISSEFSGDVVGINANKIPDMIDSIEEYINRVKDHLNQIKTNASTENAMKGEYAAAVKAYVEAACDVCYKITSQLRYFEDKLMMVFEAYTQKDQNLASTINETTSEMNASWSEYKSGNQFSGVSGTTTGSSGSTPSSSSSNITIGEKIPGGLSTGYTTANDAINGSNSVSLDQNYVNSNSEVMGFYDGKNQILNNGSSLNEVSSSSGIPENKIGIMVGQNGTPQAWTTSQEMKNTNP